VKPLLHFYGNNQKLCVVVSGIWLNSTKERHCRVYKAAFSVCLYRSLTRTFTIHTKCTVALPRQYCLRNLAAVWHYTCVLRRKPAAVYNVAYHNNVYVRNMSGFDITAKLCVLCFDGNYCNELITVLAKTTIEPNYDKCNQYKGISVLYHQYVKYQFSVTHNKLTTTREPKSLSYNVNYIPCKLFRKELCISSLPV
jgi:hypothetical protein